MKFLVRRTSSHYDGDICPVGKTYKAVKETYPKIEQRTLSEEAFDVRFGPSEGPWRSKGVNHRSITKHLIEREHPNALTGWFIEIDTLEELIEFVDRHGECVIGHMFMSNVREIEIVDDYRE